VADLQRVLPHDDPLHEQLQDPLLLQRLELIQPGSNPFAERRQLSPDDLDFLPTRSQLLSLGGVCLQDLTTVLYLLAPLPQLVQADHLGLVGIDQPNFFAIEAPKLDVHLPISCERSRGRVAGRSDEGLELVRQGRRVIEQESDMTPDRGIQIIRPHIRPRAAGLMGWADRLAATALVVTPTIAALAGLGGADHRAATPPTGEQATEEIEMAIVAARAQGRIPRELSDCMLMRTDINDGRDGDRDPFLSRPLAPTSLVVGSAFPSAGIRRGCPVEAVGVADTGIHRIRHDAVDDGIGPHGLPTSRSPGPAG
jgi:hypothetical protein